MSGYCYTVLYYPEVDAAYLPKPGEEIHVMGPVFATRSEAVKAMNMPDELPAIKEDRLPVDPYILTLREERATNPSHGGMRLVEIEHATNRQKNPVFAGMYPFLLDTGPGGPEIDFQPRDFSFGSGFQAKTPPTPKQTRVEPQTGKPAYSSDVASSLEELLSLLRSGRIYRAEDIAQAVEEVAETTGEDEYDVAAKVAEAVDVEPGNDAEDTAHKVSAVSRADLAERDIIDEEEAEDTAGEEDHSRDEGWNLSDAIYDSLVQRFGTDDPETACNTLASRCSSRKKATESLRYIASGMAKGEDPIVEVAEDKLYVTKKGSRANAVFTRAYNKALIRLFGLPDDFALTLDDKGKTRPRSRLTAIANAAYAKGGASTRQERPEPRSVEEAEAAQANDSRVSKGELAAYSRALVNVLTAQRPDTLRELVASVDSVLSEMPDGTLEQNLATNRRNLMGAALENWPDNPFPKSTYNQKNAVLANEIASRLGLPPYAPAGQNISFKGASEIFRSTRPEVTSPSTRRAPAPAPKVSADYVARESSRILAEEGLDKETQTFMLDMLKGLLKSEERTRRYTRSGFSAFMDDLTSKKGPSAGAYPFPYLPRRDAQLLALSLGYYNVDNNGNVKGDLKGFYEDVIVDRNFSGRGNVFRLGGQAAPAVEIASQVESGGSSITDQIRMMGGALAGVTAFTGA